MRDDDVDDVTRGRDLSPGWCTSYAIRVQRAWHFDGYSAAEQQRIRERAEQLARARPASWLARHWQQVYR